MQRASHVFVVGRPRSGTSLMRGILNQSDSVAILDETHLFEAPRIPKSAFDLAANRPARNISEAACHGSYALKLSGKRGPYGQMPDWSGEPGARRLINQLEAQSPPFWTASDNPTGYQELLDEFLESNRTSKDFLDFLMRVYGGQNPILGEKTPAHVYYVPTLLSWYPEARVIHLIRDVRGIFASQKRKWDIGKHSHPSLLHRAVSGSNIAYETYALFCIAIGWLRVLQLDQQYRRLYPDNYRAVRYEDLVRMPETVVAEMCEFIGIPFSQQMLNHTVHNSSHKPADGSTESVESSPFRDSSIDKWREIIHPNTQRCLRLFTGHELRRLGYEP